MKCVQNVNLLIFDGELSFDILFIPFEYLKLRYKKCRPIAFILHNKTVIRLISRHQFSIPTQYFIYCSNKNWKISLIALLKGFQTMYM